MTKAKTFRELTDEELAQRGREVDRELFHLRMQQATAQVENPSRIRLLRRDRARVRTVTNERRREADD